MRKIFLQGCMLSTAGDVLTLFFFCCFAHSLEGLYRGEGDKLKMDYFAHRSPLSAVMPPYCRWDHSSLFCVALVIQASMLWGPDSLGWQFVWGISAVNSILDSRHLEHHLMWTKKVSSPPFPSLPCPPNTLTTMWS
jgi:hypothetical protein